MLRNVQPHDEALLQRVCESVRQRGFINYFGLQRFGTGEAHCLGLNGGCLPLLAMHAATPRSCRQPVGRF